MSIEFTEQASRPADYSRSWLMLTGALSALLFFGAGIYLWNEANSLTHLRSVGGNSVAESYYQTMGEYGMAYAVMSFAAGFGILAITLGFMSVSRAKESAQTSAPRVDATARTSPAQSDQPLVIQAPAPPAVPEVRFVYCAKCGTRGPSNAEACSRCGNVV